MNGKVFALFAVSLMALAAVCATPMFTDDSSASIPSPGSASDPLSSISGNAWDLCYYTRGVYVKVGGTVNITESSDWSEDLYATDVTPGFGLFVSNDTLSGTISKAGTITVTWRQVEKEVGEEDTWYTTIYAVATSFTVNFNGNGGTATSGSATANQGSAITLPSASKPYCTFAGWYTAASGGTRVGGAGDSYTVSGNTTLYAQYNVVNVSFTTSHDTEYVVQGSSFSYTVGTSPSDAAISVNGASWLTVSGKTIAGTASQAISPGTYHVTITANYGTQSANQTFDIVVVEKLIFESVPTGGIIAIPV